LTVSELPFVTGSGGALVVLFIWLLLFLEGKIHTEREFAKLEEENQQLREENLRQQQALELERKAANDAKDSGQLTNQLLTAFVTIATGKVPVYQLPPYKPVPPQLPDSGSATGGTVP
jgi:hypothetical protein